MTDKTDVLRLDKNIAQNIDIIMQDHLGLTQEDKSLIKNLIYYFCSSRQNNIFGFGSLDPKKFAQEFKYPEVYLRKKHSNPYQLKNLSSGDIEQLYRREKETGEKVFDSNLENALYILHTGSLRFSRTAKEIIFEDNSVKYTTLSKSYILMPELKVVTVKSRGTPKITFNYSIDTKFITNLSLYFLKCRKESLIALRKRGLDDLYLFLTNLKNTLLEKVKNRESYDNSVSFNLLCQIARIRFRRLDGKEYSNKRDIKQKLIAALKDVKEQTELQFSVEWTKNHETDCYEYLPHIIFDGITAFLDRKTTGIVEKMNRNDERNKIFLENLTHALFECYKSHNVNRDDIENKLFEWLSGKRNRSEIEFAFRQAQYKSYGRIHKDIDRIVREWLNHLPLCSSMDQLYKYSEIKQMQEILIQ